MWEKVGMIVWAGSSSGGETPAMTTFGVLQIVFSRNFFYIVLVFFSCVSAEVYTFCV